MGEKVPSCWLRATIAVLLIAVVAHLAWVGCSWHWIRQRQEALTDLERYFLFPNWMTESRRAPGMLWLLGETGVPYLITDPEIPYAGHTPAELSRLFPEARWISTSEFISGHP